MKDTALKYDIQTKICKRNSGNNRTELILDKTDQ